MHRSLWMIVAVQCEAITVSSRRVDKPGGSGRQRTQQPNEHQREFACSFLRRRRPCFTYGRTEIHSATHLLPCHYVVISDNERVSDNPTLLRPSHKTRPEIGSGLYHRPGFFRRPVNGRPSNFSQKKVFNFRGATHTTLLLYFVALHLHCDTILFAWNCAAVHKSRAKIILLLIVSTF